MKIKTDISKIEEILARSVDSVYPSKKVVKDALLSGKQLKIYVGIDPTADYVHLGHSTNYLLLERLHELGHKIIVLVGDFTAMIGDPSDKTSARVRLTREEILKNVKTFKKQIGKILDFDNPQNPVEFKFNSEWLSKLNFEQLADLASNFTVQQMIERDMFEKRIAEGKPLYVHEFFYPLMQGYDSVALGVDMEIGGTDQTFNMLAGRTLVRRYQNREKYIITTTLLVNPVTGEKMMSKSFGTGIGLDEPPKDMFGKTMALPDAGIIQVFVDCTRLPMDEIKKKKARLEKGENPRNLKLELAQEIVRMYHGEKAALSAEKEFLSVHRDRNLPEEMREFKGAGKSIVKILVESSLAKSASDARRLIDQGGVKINGQVLEKGDYGRISSKDVVLQVGKRNFIKIK